MKIDLTQESTRLGLFKVAAVVISVTSYAITGDAERSMHWLEVSTAIAAYLGIRSPV